MPLRIAFDLDGVLADMESGLVRQARKLFGEATTDRLRERPAEPAPAIPLETAEPLSYASDPVDQVPSPPVDRPPSILTLNLTLRQQHKLWRHVESIENFWETLTEIEPGAIARLSAMASDRRWEIIFLTKRPATSGASAQVQTQRWLEAHGFALPSVFVVQGSRGLIAAALGLDFVIDDRPENCLDVVVDSKARVILVWREPEKLLPSTARRLGMGVVKTTAECLDMLAALDTPGARRSGLMNRVRRLLGVNEPTRV